MYLNRGVAFRHKNYKQVNSDLRKMQSEMISNPCQHFSSVSASIDTEVDHILVVWQQASCIFIIALPVVINIQTQ